MSLKAPSLLQQRETGTTDLLSAPAADWVREIKQWYLTGSRRPALTARFSPVMSAPVATADEQADGVQSPSEPVQSLRCD